MRDEGVDGAHRGGRVTVTSSAQMRCNNPGLVPFLFHVLSQKTSPGRPCQSYLVTQRTLATPSWQAPLLVQRYSRVTLGYSCGRTRGGVFCILLKKKNAERNVDDED